MKIVIELPADDFNAIYHGGLCNIKHDRLDQCITEAFQTATIIPKGHGDLIDRSKLSTHYVSTEDGEDLAVYLEPTIDCADAVIPADKVSDDSLTYEEAIELITYNKSVFQNDSKMTEAFNLAIKALQQSKGEFGHESSN